MLQQAYLIMYPCGKTPGGMTAGGGGLAGGGGGLVGGGGGGLDGGGGGLVGGGGGGLDGGGVVEGGFAFRGRTFAWKYPEFTILPAGEYLHRHSVHRTAAARAHAGLV
jgi:hypothetical protein